MDSAIKKAFKDADEKIQQGILSDNDLYGVLQPCFASKSDARDFVKKCLTNIKTRRMLLRVQWYTELADDIVKVREGRPALRLIFLMAMAEHIEKNRLGDDDIGSWNAIWGFFSNISKDDKEKLGKSFRRTLLNSKYHSLRFSSIIRILYDIRNRAVHGVDFWSFSFLDQATKSKAKASHYTHYSLITSGLLGKRGRKRRVSLDLTLTYEELRDIMVRTAVSSIKTLL